MTFEAFITRTADGREVDFERDFEREPVIQIARTLYQKFSQGSKYYALLANLSLPTGKAHHTRQVDALLLTEDGLGVLDFKNALAPFEIALDNRPWQYNNGRNVKAGSWKNPYQQIEAQRQSVYLKLRDLPQYINASKLPKPFQQHARRNLKSRRSNKHFYHFEVSGRVVLTGERFQLPDYKREKHQRWFDVIWMDDCAQFAKTLSFNRGVRLSTELLKVLIHDVFQASPWIELESLYRKPFGYLHNSSMAAPVPLLQASVTMGRSTDLPVRVRGAFKHVSRRHATIRHTPEGAIIHDAGSTNGTWVNGVRLTDGQEVHLRHRDRIILGKVEGGHPAPQSVQYTYLTALDMPSDDVLPEMEETVGVKAVTDKLLNVSLQEDATEQKGYLS